MRSKQEKLPDTPQVGNTPPTEGYPQPPYRAEPLPTRETTRKHTRADQELDSITEAARMQFATKGHTHRPRAEQAAIEVPKPSAKPTPQTGSSLDAELKNQLVSDLNDLITIYNEFEASNFDSRSIKHRINEQIIKLNELLKGKNVRREQLAEIFGNVESIKNFFLRDSEFKEVLISRLIEESIANVELDNLTDAIIEKIESEKEARNQLMITAGEAKRREFIQAISAFTTFKEKITLTLEDLERREVELDELRLRSDMYALLLLSTLKEKRDALTTPEHSNKSAETQTLSPEDQSVSASSPVSTSTQTASSTGKNVRKNYRRTPSLHTRLLSNYTKALSLHTNALLHHAKVLSLYNTRKIKIKKRALQSQPDSSLVQSFDLSGVQREEATARATLNSERQTFLEQEQGVFFNNMVLDHYRRMQKEQDEIALERQRAEDEADRREAEMRDYHQRMLLELDARRSEIEEALHALEESRRDQPRPATQEIQTATDSELATTGTQATLMVDAATSTEPVTDPRMEDAEPSAAARAAFNDIVVKENESRKRIQENEANLFKLVEEYKKRMQIDEQAMSDALAQKETMAVAAHASTAIPPLEEKARKAIIDQQENARAEILKMIAIQGKSYFDDYAEEAYKQKIAQDTITQHKSLSAHPEESRTRTRTPETKHFLQYKDNPETDVDYKKTVKKETEGDTKPAEIESATTFHFTQKKNETESTEVKLIREAKPFDPQKKSREVLWRVEGKTNRTLAEQYEDIAQQSISFNVAEHLMLAEEINSLETSNENNSRLSELKELQKNAKPTEISIIIPGQREKDRKSYKSDDFNDLPNTITIPSREVRLTPKEFLALKAHLNYFEVVTCNGVKFSTKAPHAFFAESLRQIDSIQTPQPPGLDHID